MSTYIEITKSKHAHGGEGWEFGTCLWCPSKNRAGHDRYSLMRKPRSGDRVIHMYHQLWPDGVEDTRLAGISTIARSLREVSEEPPSPGDWAGMSPYYRIDLRDYQGFPHPLEIHTLLSVYGDEIRADLVENRHRFYPFTTRGEGIRTVQGIYLAHCSETLLGILQQALSISKASPSPDAQMTNHEEYSESRRSSRERYFFARNPQLARDAKRTYGYTCQVCRFDFEHYYGDLGREYIEAHHLDPLSERPEAEWSDEICTSLNRVAVVCSNCHRMLHRKRPAVSIEELIQGINKRRAQQDALAYPDKPRH